MLHSDKEDFGSVLARAHASLNDKGVFFISLKKGPHREETKEEEYGVRTFYYYEPKDIRELAGDMYKVVYEHTQTIRGQEWLEMILQK